jgi:hypothetical protein
LSVKTTCEKLKNDKINGQTCVSKQEILNQGEKLFQFFGKRNGNKMNWTDTFCQIMRMSAALFTDGCVGSTISIGNRSYLGQNSMQFDKMMIFWKYWVSHTRTA